MRTDRIEMNETVETQARHEGSWGATEWQTTTLSISASVNFERNRGCFEIYDIETGGDRFYAEGGIWISDCQTEVADYDGMFDLDFRIKEWLQSEGVFCRWG
jgi:hypothetical protein